MKVYLLYKIWYTVWPSGIKSIKKLTREIVFQQSKRNFAYIHICIYIYIFFLRGGGEVFCRLFLQTKGFSRALPYFIERFEMLIMQFLTVICSCDCCLKTSCYSVGKDPRVKNNLDTRGLAPRYKVPWSNSRTAIPPPRIPVTITLCWADK